MGQEVIIGMVNTGVSEDHSDLVFKIKDFAKIEPSGRIAPSHSFDLHGHGSHCAGIMVGGNSSGVQIGGAPSAQLKAASIMDGHQSWFSSLLTAIDWLADPYRAADVINLSVGVDVPSSEEADLFDATVYNVSLQNGVVMVAAIGNDRTQSMYPARLSNVIGCGALSAGEKVWDSSGTDPDFILPGESVYSCLPMSNPNLGGQSYGWFSGSSMACAHMTALVAMLAGMRRDAGLNRIIRAFRDTASNQGVYDKRSGWGVPDLLRAIDSC